MALSDMIRNTLDAAGRKAILVGMRPKVNAFLKTQNILKPLDEEFIHKERSSALNHAARIIDSDK